MRDRPRRTDEDPVTYGIRTGRLAPSRAADWRQMIADGTISPGFIEESLPPHLEVGVAASDGGVPAPSAGSKYALNPLYDQLPRRIAASAALTKEPPKLFGDVDLPPRTASGLDPQVLVTLPWKARHAVADAPTVDCAQDLIAACSGPEGDSQADGLAEHHGVRKYRAAMTDWALEMGIVNDVDIDPRTGGMSVRIWQD